jgi:hypothetical protein
MDVMLPTPEGVADSATEDGFTTGIYLVGELMEYILRNRCLVVFLTNRDLDIIEECIEESGLPREVIEIVPKCEAPDIFVANLRSRFEQMRVERNHGE